MKENIRQLGDVVQPRRKKVAPQELPKLPYVGLEHIEAHTSRLIGSSSAAKMKSAANLFYPGDVLYSRLRPYLNKVWRADREGLCSSEFIVLPGNDAIDADFLRYRLNSSDFVSFANSLNAGDRPRVDFDQISKFETWIPPSLDQQRQIVAEIEKQFTRMDAGVAALRRVEAKLKRYRAAVLEAACQGRLIDNPVEDWRTVAIRDCIKIIDYRGRTPPFADSGIPHFRSQNVRNGRVIREDLTYVTPESYDAFMTRGLPQLGDVLFTTEAPMGEVAPVPDEKFSVAQRIMILRPNSSILDSRFLIAQLRSPDFQSRLRKSGTGSTVTGVSSRNFQPMTLRIPTLSEQGRIAAEVERRLSVVDELENVVTASIARASRLRQSILRGVFHITGHQITQWQGIALATEDIMKARKPLKHSKTRRTILEVLEGAPLPLSPEELYAACGRSAHEIEQVEEFYQELSAVIEDGAVTETRNGETIFLSKRS